MMAFVEVEDIYGIIEVIVFDSVFSKCSNILEVDNIIIVDGKVSIREDEEAKIVARDIKLFNKKKSPKLKIKVEEDKINQAISLLKFFEGENNNIDVELVGVGVPDNPKYVGKIFLTQSLLSELKGENLWKEFELQE